MQQLTESVIDGSSSRNAKQLYIFREKIMTLQAQFDRALNDSKDLPERPRQHDALENVWAL